MDNYILSWQWTTTVFQPIFFPLRQKKGQFLAWKCCHKRFFNTKSSIESKSFLGTATHHLFLNSLEDAKIPTYEIPNREFHPLEKGTTNRQNRATLQKKKKMSRGSFGKKKGPLIQVFWSYDHLPRMSGDIFCLCAFHVLKHCS